MTKTIKDNFTDMRTMTYDEFVEHMIKENKRSKEEAIEYANIFKSMFKDSSGGK